MSYRKEKHLALAGIDNADKTPEQIQELFLNTLKKGMHGLCFSAYEEGQEPGVILQVEQIKGRMEIIAPYTKWIRSFSCIEGHELIPQVAHDFGLKTLVGAWLSSDKLLNEKEIKGLIEVARNGHVDIAAVGNEVLYRGDLTVEELLEYIFRVKEALPNVQIGYVDAYYEFTQHPEIVQACDVILSNCYPYWEGCHMDYSLLYMKEMFHKAVRAGNGKKVIITETGWPSEGSSCKDAHPSKENALRYFMNTQQWSKEEGIDIFYFTSFDESWKVGTEGDVGAYWGLWDSNGELKNYK